MGTKLHVALKKGIALPLIRNRKILKGATRPSSKKGKMQKKIPNPTGARGRGPGKKGWGKRVEGEEVRVWRVWRAQRENAEEEK